MAIESPISADYFTGEDKVLEFAVYEADGTTVQDLSGWTLSWMLKRRLTDADAAALITKTTTGGITITDATHGVCQVTLTDADIADLLASVLYFHELKRMDAGFETVLSYGRFTLQQAVHRA